MKLWKIPFRPLEPFEPLIYGNLGALPPSNPWTLKPQEKTLYPLDPETVGLWKHQTLESLS